jgi:hypothetical protein
MIFDIKAIYIATAMLFVPQNEPIHIKINEVVNQSTIKKVEDRDVTFGVKENIEEIFVNDGYFLDSNGMDVQINIDSIYSPAQELNIIGLKWFKKDYIIETSICIGTKCVKGTAKKTAYVFAAFLDVTNNEVPLNRKTFSKTLQKSLENTYLLLNK